MDDIWIWWCIYIYMDDIIYIWFYGWSSWDNYHGPWISSSWMILNYMDDIWVMVHSDHSWQRCGRASGAVTVLWRCNCLGECFMWLTTKVDTVCDTVFFCMADSWRLCTRFSFPSGRSQPAFSSFRIWSLRPPRWHALSPAQMLHEISIK